MWLEYFVEAFTNKHPVFMSLITISGLAAVISTIWMLKKPEGQRKPDTILAAGLIALIISLLIYPIEAVALFKALNDAENFSVAIVGGGIFVDMIPLFYGGFWFIVSFISWKILKRTDAEKNLSIY